MHIKKLLIITLLILSALCVSKRSDADSLVSDDDYVCPDCNVFTRIDNVNVNTNQDGTVLALLNRSRELMNSSMSNLSSQLVNDNVALFNTHRVIDAIAVSGNVSNSTRESIYAFYTDEINTHDWLKSNVTINNSNYPYLAALRAQIYMSFVDTLSLTNQTKDHIAQTIQLKGRYLDIWNEFSVLIHDNNGFDPVQLDVIYNFFDLIPLELQDLGGIISKKELGVDKFAFEVKSGVNIFNDRVGRKTEDSFPSDAPASAMVDGFTITLIHEVHHRVDVNYIGKNITIFTQTQEQNVTFKERKQDLIDTAGVFHLNYLREQSNGYFDNSPQEFFASVSNQWFANTSNTLMHGITRFRNGYTDPLNQFLFFAEVYSEGENHTLFYNSDTQGNITRSIALVTRDAYGHINSLTVDGVQWSFTLDKRGNVIAIATPPLEGELTSPTPSLEVLYGHEVDSSDRSLAALWHFNENSGNTTFDDSDNRNDGTRGNATAGTQPVWTTGKFGYALDFDGSNDYVSVPDDPSIRISQNITVMAWVKPNADRSYRTIVRNGENGALNYKLEIRSDDRLTFSFDTAEHGTKSVTSAVTALGGIWSHVVGTYDNTMLKVYINGIERASTQANGTLKTTSSQDLAIGWDINQNQWFNGTIDEVAIYDRSLSGLEIKELYSKALPDGPHNVTRPKSFLQSTQ